MSARTMIVTGASNGIGRRIALNAAHGGYRVVVADIDAAGAQTVVDMVSTEGGDATYAAVDMAVVDSVAEMIDSTVRSHGSVDVLVNNAAITRSLSLFEVDPESWDAFFAVNARGCFFAMQHAAAAMQQSGAGSIVNIASIAGKGWPGTSNIAYASTKGAVIAMTRVAAAELGPTGIRVNAVCPGVTETSLFRRVIHTRADQGGATVDEQVAQLASLASLRRITQPEDVSAAVLFLASHDAAGITGQTVNVDSGIMWD